MVLGAVLVLTLATSAAAQEVPTPDEIFDTPQSRHEPVSGVEALDTDTTPYAKDGAQASSQDRWKQVAGAQFPTTAGGDPTRLVSEDSPTGYDDNLFDVAFASAETGLAVGARCQSSDPDADLTHDPADLGCRPVAFLYTDTPENPDTWEEVVGLPGATKDGFIGAVAWLDESTAMAVGGTGTYPRREPPYGRDIAGRPCELPANDLEPFGWNCDQAGEARAWLYRDGEWCELGSEPACPALPVGREGESAHGLTAAAFRTYNDGRVLGFVGGLGQIWRWQGSPAAGGRFDRLYDNRSGPSDLFQQTRQLGTLGLGPQARGRLFRFRVRDIRIAPTTYSHAYAVTSGCCSQYDTTNRPVLLTYTDVNNQDPRWYAYQPTSGLSNTFRPSQDPETAVDWANETGAGPVEVDPDFSSGPEEPIEVVPRVESLEERGMAFSKPEPPATPAHQSGVENPDSFYSLITTKPSNHLVAPPVALLATSASTDSQLELASEIWRCGFTGGHTGDRFGDSYQGGLTLGVGPIALSTARLLAIGGTVQMSSCEGSPDWAVGELRSLSEPGHGRQGLVVATRTAARTVQPANTNPALEEVIGGQYEPTSEGRIRDSQASLQYLSTSYTLNSIDMVGDSGAGWAVGDHGAILRIGGRGTGGARRSEPDPPFVQRSRSTSLPERGSYETPPAAEHAGAVPSVSNRPTHRLPEPRLQNAGTPDASFRPESGGKDETEEVGQIVMSRDGSEGWAVGPNPIEAFNTTDTGYGVASFYHYDGAGWTRCDPVGIRGQLSPDRACRAVAGLRRYMIGNAAHTVKLVGAARVPLEKDGDPTNDDDFEVVAIGTRYRDPETQPTEDDPVVLRYSAGEWEFEPLAARSAITSVVRTAQFPNTDTANGALTLKDIAFTAPDDGWILARHSLANASGTVNELYHYNGTRWERCRLDDPDNVVYSPEDKSIADCGTERIPAKEPRSGINHMQMRLVPAGDRVYVFGHRLAGGVFPPGSTPVGDVFAGQSVRVPFILFHERGGDGWSDGQGEGGEGGGYDPAWSNPAPDLAGEIDSLAVGENGDGSWSGWATGRFFDTNLPDGGNGRDPAAVVMRLDPDDGNWRRYRDPLLDDYLWPWPARDLSWHGSEPRINAVLPGAEGDAGALIANSGPGRLFAFDPAEERWHPVSGQRPPVYDFSVVKEGVAGSYQAIVPDNAGGAWLAVKNAQESAPGVNGGWGGGGQVFFYHYTDSPPEPVFDEVPNPFGDRDTKLTALAAAPDGSVWLGTDSPIVARYERASGWQVARIPGWDPGRVVTVKSEVNAIAAASDGSAVAVGKGGRIAELTPAALRLDAAASVVCGGTGLGPGCGTSRDLHAVAIAPDGSALAGGDASAALWRPPGGPFGRIADPPGGINARITAISMPAPDRAWIANDKGFVFAGRMSAPGEWSWQLENKIRSGPTKGLVLGAASADINLPLRAIALDVEGRGYAVGDNGLVLERTGDGEQPWRRVRGPGTDDLTTVTLTAGDGDGALIGGRNGVVWTVSGGEVALARPTDFFRFDGFNSDTNLQALTGPVVGAALLPGTVDGATEAWVAIQERGTGTNRLLHYASDPSEPLMNPSARARPLPDSPPPREGELRFAALGKSDCQATIFCPPMVGTSDTAEVEVSRIVGELGADGGAVTPEFALFTGDATNGTGAAGTSVSTLDRKGDLISALAPADFGLTTYAPRGFGARHHRRFSDWVLDPLSAVGVPLFGTPGPGDLSRPYSGILTLEVGERTKTGENLAYRKGLEDAAEPWGSGEEPRAAGGLTFEQARGADSDSEPFPDQTLDPDLDDNRQLIAEPVEVKGWARTHYAVDLSRGDEVVARLVAVDSSLRALSTADPLQNPVERGGQLQWLERMLCFRGQSSPGGGACTREPSQQAIVLTNTPTYTYNPQLDPSATASDAAVLESLYLRYRVSVVVSGRLGWNGLYYALAPGLHTPCPGGAYPSHAPEPGVPLCESVAARLPVSDPTGQVPDPDPVLGAAEQASGTTLPTAGDVLGGLGETGGLVPFVVASGAGGKFGPQAEAQSGSATDGFWHGYTIVRLAADGDPRKLIVEQRPVLDWVAIEADDYLLSARQELRLKGIGREPIGFSQAGAASSARYNVIATPAITHRFDLVLADPERAWVPCEATNPACVKLAERLSSRSPGAEARDPAKACSPYVCLPENVGTVDSQSGAVEAGNGKYPDTFAVAILSVGDRAATYPLMFRKSPSFVVQPFALAPPLPTPPHAAPKPPSPPQPPNPPTPDVPQPSVPQVPGPPPVPPLEAAAPPEPLPPAPPSPPPPAEQLSPLTLTINPASLTVATPSTVIQPPTPPVNPAPPSGARREARQRQAAAQKSGADSEESGSDVGELGGDMAQGKHTPDQAFRRAERGRPEPSFTPLARADQPSAWAQGALYTGGLTLMAFALAAGFSRGRPTPRRRPPEVPAPSWAQLRRR